MTRNTLLSIPLRLSLASAAAAVGMFTTTVARAAELDAAAIERGKVAAATCVACHQANGSGMNIPGGESWPRLTGLDPEYLAAQIHAFKDGTRENASMLAFANMLNDEQIQDVAAYYASLPVTVSEPPAASDELLAHGEYLALEGDWNRYIVSCTSCHGVGNQGNGSVFPGLAGQHPGYIAQQITAWQKGTRKNDPQHLMRAIAERLNEHDVNAVSAWLATQPAKAQE